MSASPPDAVAAAVEPPQAPVRPAASLAVRRRGRRLLRGRVRPLLVADALALVSAGAVAYAVAEAVAAPAVIAPGWTLAPLALAAVVTLLGSFALHGLYERQSREIAPQTFDEVTTLLHALLTASVLWLLVSQTLFRLAGYAVFTPDGGGPLRGRRARRRRGGPLGHARLGRPRRRPAAPHGDHRRRHDRPPGRAQARRAPGVRPGGRRASWTTIRAPPPRCWAPRPSCTRIVDELDVDWVILAASHGEVSEALLERVRAVRRPDVHLSIVPTYFELFASNATIEELEGVPMVSLPPMRLSRSRRALKRTFDLVVAAAALVVLAPVLVVVARRGQARQRAGRCSSARARSGRGGRALPDREVPHDGRRRRGPARVAGRAERDLSGAALQDPLRPARHPRRARSCAPGASTSCRSCGTSLRGEMSLVGPRPFVVHEAAPDHRLGRPPARDHARHHRAVAGARPQRHPVRRDGEARLRLRDQLVALVGHEDPVPDACRWSSRAGGRPDARLRGAGLQRGGQPAAPARSTSRSGPSCGPAATSSSSTTARPTTRPRSPATYDGPLPVAARPPAPQPGPRPGVRPRLPRARSSSATATTT